MFFNQTKKNFEQFLGYVSSIYEYSANFLKSIRKYSTWSI